MKSLINKKVLDAYRINNTYYHLIVDGVCLFSYSKKHVENCLVRKHESEICNYHIDMLVAIIAMGNIMLPVDFEMIENKLFNDMKNHGYHLGHAFSYDGNALQGHFLLQMIAIFIMQMLEYEERVKERFTTIRNIGTKIKEALRNTVLSANEIRDIFKATQFRRPFL